MDSWISPNDGEDAEPGASLRSVLESVGPVMLTVLDAPETGAPRAPVGRGSPPPREAHPADGGERRAGLEARVLRTVIHDAADPLPDGTGSVLLLVGADAEAPQTVETVREAAAAGYVAAVVKLRGGNGRVLARAARAAGVALLATPDDAAWRQVDALLSSALGASGAGERSPGANTASGDELFTLANALAGAVGGPVVIEDLEQHVLAYSTLPGQPIDEFRRRGILDRRVPVLAEQVRQYREVLNAPGMLRMPPLGDEELPRAAVAIRAGDLPLGTIWVIEGGSPIDAAGERALADGARLAALHMLRRRSGPEIELQAREQALRGALEGAASETDTRARLGLSAGTPVTLVGLAPLSGNADTAALTARAGAAVARHWSAVQPEAAVASTARAVYVLVPEGADGAVRRLAAQTLTVVERVLGLRMRAALSRPSTDLGQIPLMRAETDDILRVISTDPRAPEVAELTDTHARVLLAHVADELARLPRLRHPGIDAMLAHDRNHGTAYAASVTAWLDAVGSFGDAARRMHVHPNTMKYRLRRARELFGLDLDDADDRLSCWIQLRLATAPPEESQDRSP
ncbi:CdaR family transcriptional regulator [Nocardiopsis sp. NRRL B-16309]|uniref:PucR family transcriptional regulator n=1 Tax=Nocardiopsis sp. NRRL B-16309 TaxID=1519494 RepID=UPI000B0C24CC|nr:PucR family transcriptional regulator [Nocardiopsis sp. NRRL B-16309]